MGATTLLLGAAGWSAAVVMPWSDRPHQMRFLYLPSPNWIWAVVLPAALFLLVVVPGVRMLRSRGHHRIDLGVAFGGSVLATLFIAQAFGWISSSPGPPGQPSVFSPTIGVYLGLGAGALMLAGTFTCARSLRQRASTRDAFLSTD